MVYNQPEREEHHHREAVLERGRQRGVRRRHELDLKGERRVGRDRAGAGAAIAASRARASVGALLCEGPRGRCAAAATNSRAAAASRAASCAPYPISRLGVAGRGAATHPSSGGIVSTAASPTCIDETPKSQPGITSPMPSVKSIGFPRLRLLSKTEPSARLPV